MGTPYEAELVEGPETRNCFTTLYVVDPNEEHLSITLSALASNQGGMVYPTGYVLIYGMGSQTPAIQQFLGKIQNFGGYKQVPFEEGPNPMLGMLGKAVGTQFTDNPDDVQPDPDPAKEVKPLPKGIRVGGSNVYAVLGPYPGEFTHVIKRLVEMMIAVAKPMLEQHLLAELDISSRVTGSQTFRSPQAEQVAQQAMEDERFQIAYYKYVINVVLSKYPALLERQNALLNRDYADIPPSPKRIDLKNSPTLRHLMNDTMNAYTAEAVITMNDVRLAELEKAIRVAQATKVGDYEVGQIMYSLSPDEFPHTLERASEGGYMSFDVLWLGNANIMSFIEQMGWDNRIGPLKQAIADGVETRIEQKDYRDLVRQVVPIMHLLPLDANMKQQLAQIAALVEQSKAKEEQARQEQARTQSMLMTWDEACINLANPGEGFQTYEYNEKFPEAVVRDPEKFLGDRYEDLQSAAYEEAQEEAGNNLESRPSETYADPDNAEQVDSDIDSDSPDFLEDINFWDDPAHDPLSQQFEDNPALESEYIQDNLREEFVAWKVEKLRAEEDSESWKYETQDDDVNEHLSEAQERIYTEAAYEEGWMNLEYDEHLHMIFAYCHSKWKQQALALLDEFVKLNIPTYREENGLLDAANANKPEKPLNRKIRIELHMVDINKFRKVYPPKEKGL